MNLYIQYRARLMWALVLDAEGTIVGQVRSDVADALIRSGAAMDLTERKVKA